MEKTIHITDLHFEHKLWLSELSFQKDELNVFQHRLEEVSIRWSDNVIRRKIEQYQNQFIRQNEVLDILIHELNEEEAVLAIHAKANPSIIDQMRFNDHTEMRDKVETQIHLYKELKKEFLRFLTSTGREN